LENDSKIKKIKNQAQGTMKSYVVGFILSLLLTLSAFLLVSEHILNHWSLNLTIVSLALIQVFIQLFFFLHLGNEPQPKWNLLVFIFMVLVVFILVAGTLWIMFNLDYRGMMMMH
jgi:cytochrome o ubiquinol oxidase operon protein cyoD